MTTTRKEKTMSVRLSLSVIDWLRREAARQQAKSGKLVTQDQVCRWLIEKAGGILNESVQEEEPSAEC